MQKNARYQKQEFVRAEKVKRGCEACGERHPAVLDLHHRNPSDKRFNVAHAAQRSWTISRIEEEMGKCAVLCSNCHRKLHWDERGKTVERPPLDFSQLPRGRRHRSDSGRRKSGPMVRDIFPKS